MTAKIAEPGRTCVAGLFHSDAEAEKAMQQLREAGFTEKEVGMASAGEPERHASFWERVSSVFGKREQILDPTDLQHSLMSCGITDEEARYFDESLVEGEVLLSVHAPTADRARVAADILEKAGADLGAGELTPAARPGAPRPAVAPASGERRIQLVGEMLRIHKDRVNRGEVRLRKDVVTEQQNIQVPVTREEVVIERTPVEGGRPGEIGAGEKEIRVPVSEERVRVEKQPVVTEEVNVGTRKVEEMKNVADKVRHEELRTEKEGDVAIPPEEKKKKIA